MTERKTLLLNFILVCLLFDFLATNRISSGNDKWVRKYLFVDHVLSVKSACHRCLLLIYGRITRHGRLTNCQGAITSW